VATSGRGVAGASASGRVSRPEEARRRFGYPDADLNARRTTPAFRELLRFEVGRARDLFHRGLPLLDLVTPDVRPDIELFVRGGLAVLKKIERIRYNVWQRRPELGKWQKAALL